MNPASLRCRIFLWLFIFRFVKKVAFEIFQHILQNKRKTGTHMSTLPIDRSAPNSLITEARPPSPKLAAVSPRGMGAGHSSLCSAPREERYTNYSSESLPKRDAPVSNDCSPFSKSVVLLQSVLSRNGGRYLPIDPVTPPPIEDVKKAILSGEYTLDHAILTGKITAYEAIQHGLAE
jgi:hypothetical protein